MHPVGPGAAVADHVHAELPARRLDRHVHLAGRNPDALGDQFEVVDQGLHRAAHDLGDVLWRVAHAVGAHLQVGRPGDLAVLDHGRARPQLVQALLDDLDRLPHFFDANDVAPVGITTLLGDHVELVVLVAAIGFAFAQVVRQPGGTQDRAGDAQRHASLEVQIADVLGAGLPD